MLGNGIIQGLNLPEEEVCPRFATSTCTLGMLASAPRADLDPKIVLRFTIGCISPCRAVKKARGFTSAMAAISEAVQYSPLLLWACFAGEVQVQSFALRPSW